MLRKSMVAVLGGVALLATPLPATAQVNTVQQVGTISNYVAKPTYSAAFFGLVPPASATDMVCIAGSATKKINLLNVTLSGTATTAVSVPVMLVRRVTVNTGGTAGTTTANPANTISKRDVNSPTATAVPISYTAVPTITDSSPTYIMARSLNLAPLATAAAVVPLEFNFAPLENLTQPPILQGAAAQFCVNFGAVSVTGGVLIGSLTWTEE
jgi:hypothetical protein